MGSFLRWVINFKLFRWSNLNFILDNQVFIMHDLKLESDLVVSIFGIGVNNQNLVFLIAFLEADFKGGVVLEALQGGIFKGCNFIIIKG